MTYEDNRQVPIDNNFIEIDDWHAYKAVMQLAQSSDAFGKHIADITQTKADIGAEYDFNPERLRIYDEGNRIFQQYNPSAKFVDGVDSWTLVPNSDNVMRLETAERFRYTVGNVVGVSRAFQANKPVTELQGDDKIILGYGNPDLENDMADADGWFWEWDAQLNEKEVRLTEYRSGTQIFSKVVKTNKGLNDWRRIEDKLNWYNVGVDNRIETYTKLNDDGFAVQVNDNLGGTANTDGKGPTGANKHVTFSIRTDANTTDLELEIGSIGVIVFGNHTAQVRAKAADYGTDYDDVTLSYGDVVVGEYEPLMAIRRDPNRRNISTDFLALTLSEFTTDADAQLLAIAVDASKTDATGFTTPVEHNEANSAVEITDNVTTFPDVNGNIVQSAANPGGFQLGMANIFVQGTGTNERRSNVARVLKRKIQNGDVLILLGISESAGDFAVTFDTEQDF